MKLLLYLHGVVRNNMERYRQFDEEAISRWLEDNEDLMSDLEVYDFVDDVLPTDDSEE